MKKFPKAIEIIKPGWELDDPATVYRNMDVDKAKKIARYMIYDAKEVDAFIEGSKKRLNKKKQETNIAYSGEYIDGFLMYSHAQMLDMRNDTIEGILKLFEEEEA